MTDIKIFDEIPEDKSTVMPDIMKIQIRCGSCHDRYIIDSGTQMKDIIRGIEADTWCSRCPWCSATNAVAIKIVDRFIETMLERRKRIGRPILDSIEEVMTRWV